MPDALVEAIIAAAIAKNEIKDALREGRHFECEACAQGVGRLLWRCPVCGKADSITGRGSLILCRRCGSRWALDANCRVEPLNAPRSLHAAQIADLKDWHDWQVSTLPELAGEADEGAPRLRSEGVVLSRREGPITRRIGRGLLYLERHGSGRRARIRRRLIEGGLRGRGGARLRRQLQRVLGIRSSRSEVAPGVRRR